MQFMGEAVALTDLEERYCLHRSYPSAPSRCTLSSAVVLGFFVYFSPPVLFICLTEDSRTLQRLLVRFDA